MVKRIAMKLDAEDLPEKLSELAREYGKLLLEKPNGPYKLYVYKDWLSAWSTFKRFGYVPALFRSTVIKYKPTPESAWLAMTKTPNLGEDEYTLKLNYKYGYRKVDGSLVAVSYDPEEEQLLIRSKGGWRNFVTETFKVYIREYGLEEQVYEMARIAKNGTVHFELVCALPEEYYRKNERALKLWPRCPKEPDRVIETAHGAVMGDEIENACLKSLEEGTVRAYLLNVKEVDLDRGLVVLHPPEAFPGWEWKPYRINLYEKEEINGPEDIKEFVQKLQREEGLMLWGAGEIPYVEGVPIDPLVKAKNRYYVLFVHMRGSLATVVYVLLSPRSSAKDELQYILGTEYGKRAMEIAELVRRAGDLLDKVKASNPNPSELGRALKGAVKGKDAGRIVAYVLGKSKERWRGIDVVIKSVVYGSIDSDSDYRRVKRKLEELIDIFEQFS